MNKTKETFILGFAIFAAFFGAGNLILPPMLGFNGGSDWWRVTIGFVISAAVIPFLALIGHAKLRGTMMDFGKKVSLKFSLIFCVCVYLIAIILACPRTAAVTHEMAIQPFFGTSSLLTSSIYFIFVFIFAVNRGKVLNILGKYLTPIIALILLIMIGVGIFSESGLVQPGIFNKAYVDGFLEGYQTYDAIGGLLVGGIVVISANNINSELSDKDKKTLLINSGLVAMMGLLLIYSGLIYIGSKYNALFDSTISRPDLLSALSTQTLGNIGNTFLSILVSMACFTTAVGIVVGTADFFKGLFNESKKAYVITAVISVVIGLLMGQFEVKFIIDIAVYTLMFIYPIAISLILLNLLPEKYASPLVFKAVVSVAFIFSIPDFLKFLIPLENLEVIYNIVPFSQIGLGWILPTTGVFLIINTAVLLFSKKALAKF